MCRSIALLVVASAGCDAVFRVDNVTVDDAFAGAPCTASAFDTAQRVAYVFLPTFAAFVVGERTSYGIGVDSSGAMFQQPLDNATATPLFAPETAFTSPALSPDGTDLFVTRMGPVFVETRYDASTSTWGTILNTGLDRSYEPGRPADAAAPADLQMIVADPKASVFRELTRTGAAWTELRRYSIGQLTAPAASGVMDQPSLTADGLALAFVVVGADNGVFYVSRPAADVAFEAARMPHGRLLAAGYVSPHLSADCTHLTAIDVARAEVVRFGP